VAAHYPWRYQANIGKNAILTQQFVDEKKCYNFIDNMKKLLPAALMISAAQAGGRRRRCGMVPP
jgi:hypothetical protein